MDAKYASFIGYLEYSTTKIATKQAIKYKENRSVARSLGGSATPMCSPLGILSIKIVECITTKKNTKHDDNPQFISLRKRHTMIT